MADDPQARIRELERQLAASRRTVDALVARAERQAETDPARFSILKAMANLEEVITARERELARRENWFRVLWDACPDSFLTVDEGGRVQDHNPAARDFGEVFTEAFEDPSAAWELLHGESINGELVLADGRPVHVNGARLERGLVLVVVRDLSLNRLLHAELVQARRLAVVGGLAATVAHEINNPLAIILGRLELLREVEDPDAAALKRTLDLIQDHAMRIGLISRNLHVFGRPGLGKRSHIQMSDLVTAAVGHGGRRLTEVDLRQDFPDDLTVYGDPVQLEQVLAAMLLHCADSMHRRGQLRLRARAEGGQFLLELRDQSAGVPEGLQERLLQPWVPSQQGNRGSMLGLSVAASIVRAHGGRLVALEDRSKGAIYQVTLPQERQEAGGLRVLLVEPRGDAEAIAQMLEQEGHTVLRARDGITAVARVAADSPDVVLASPYLAGLDGQSLPQALSDRFPNLRTRVVLLLEPEQAGPPSIAALRKPLVLEELAAALSAVMARTA